MPNARKEAVSVLGQRVVKLTLASDWKWSSDIAPVVGTTSCQAAHVGVIVEGTIHGVCDDGSEATYTAADPNVEYAYIADRLGFIRIAIEAGVEQVSLQALVRAELVVGEGRQRRLRRLHARHLLREPLGAPVRELPVKLVAARHDGEGRVRREELVEEGPRVRLPLRVGHVGRERGGGRLCCGRGRL